MDAARRRYSYLLFLDEKHWRARSQTASLLDAVAIHTLVVFALMMILTPNRHSQEVQSSYTIELLPPQRSAVPKDIAALPRKSFGVHKLAKNKLANPLVAESRVWRKRTSHGSNMAKVPAPSHLKSPVVPGTAQADPVPPVVSDSSHFGTVVTRTAPGATKEGSASEFEDWRTNSVASALDDQLTAFLYPDFYVSLGNAPPLYAKAESAAIDVAVLEQNACATGDSKLASEYRSEEQQKLQLALKYLAAYKASPERDGTRKDHALSVFLNAYKGDEESAIVEWKLYSATHTISLDAHSQLAFEAEHVANIFAHFQKPLGMKFFLEDACQHYTAIGMKEYCCLMKEKLAVTYRALGESLKAADLHREAQELYSQVPSTGQHAIDVLLYSAAESHPIFLPIERHSFGHDWKDCATEYSDGRKKKVAEQKQMKATNCR